MGWANRAIEELREGRAAVVPPHGNSMRPIVEAGGAVTLGPIEIADLRVGDIVLCRVAGNVYLHLVTAIEGSPEDRRVHIGNARGRINGWTKAVYGKAIVVEEL